MTKCDIIIDIFRNQGIIRLIINELENTSYLNKKIEGGGTNMYIKQYFLELKRIFMLKQISMILSNFFTLCSMCARRLNKLYLFFVSNFGYTYPLNKLLV